MNNKNKGSEKMDIMQSIKNLMNRDNKKTKEEKPKSEINKSIELLRIKEKKLDNQNFQMLQFITRVLKKKYSINQEEYIKRTTEALFKEFKEDLKE